MRRHYPIDMTDLVRGFSMGGAATWHLAVHDPSRWAAANPGGRLCRDAAVMQNVFHKVSLSPTWWESEVVSTSTTAPTGPTICGTVPDRQPIRAKSIRKSRRLT